MKRFDRKELTQMLRKAGVIGSAEFIKEALASRVGDIDMVIHLASKRSKDPIGGLLHLAHKYSTPTEVEALPCICLRIEELLYGSEIKSGERQSAIQKLAFLKERLAMSICTKTLHGSASADDYRKIYGVFLEKGYPDSIRREILYRWIRQCTKPRDFSKLLRTILPKHGKPRTLQVVKDGYFVKLIVRQMDYCGALKKAPEEKAKKKLWLKIKKTPAK